MRWLLDSHLYKEVRKFVKDVFMENNIVKIQGKRTFRTGTYRFMWIDENTINGKSEILYDIYR
eukprot:Gb_08895 [translate_table: standard]